MKNVTLAIEEDVLRKARVRAARQGTSVNEVVRRYLREYAGHDDRIDKALDRFLEAAGEYHGRIRGGKFRREEAYEDGTKRGR